MGDAILNLLLKSTKAPRAARPIEAVVRPAATPIVRPVALSVAPRSKDRHAPPAVALFLRQFEHRAAMAERRRRQERRKQQRRHDPWGMPVAGTSVVVATYNVHKCVGVDRRHDPERIAAVLRELGADIICLQEVVARENGPQPLDHAAFLADATGYHLVTAPAREDHRGRFGNAVLSRFPIRSARRIDLSIAGHWPRGAVDVDVDAEGRKLR